MAKIDQKKLIQKRRTHDEMLLALHDIATGCEKDIDDPAIVLSDCIQELLQNRQIVEDVKGFVSLMATKTSRQ
jgi:hypothetical protein